jgi:membrane protein implicated in regulation of membrane protease activity
VNIALWSNIFFGCFLFGFVLTMVSLLVGFGHHHFDGGNGHHFHVGHGDGLGHGNGQAHGHIAGHGHVGSHAHAAHAAAGHAAHTGSGSDANHHGTEHPEHFSVLGIINYNTVVMFITWFGAAGYLLLQMGLSALWVLAGAAVSGLAGGMIIYLFMEKVLRKGETRMDPNDYYLPGTLARVASRIREGGTGEIVYEQGGTRKTAGARGDELQGHAQGEEVVIVRYEKGIAYVRTPTYKQHLAAAQPATPAAVTSTVREPLRN